MTTAYETQATRDAVAAITNILAALPLAQRADVVEEAFGGALPIAFADSFKETFGNDPVPTMLIGGEIASDAIDLYEEPAQ